MVRESVKCYVLHFFCCLVDIKIESRVENMRLFQAFSLEFFYLCSKKAYVDAH